MIELHGVGTMVEIRVGQNTEIEAGIVLGDLVKVEAVRADDGSLLAIEIKLAEDELGEDIENGEGDDLDADENEIETEDLHEAEDLDEADNESEDLHHDQNTHDSGNDHESEGTNGVDHGISG